MHEFVKKWLLLIMKIISECEFKKVMDHLYSYEYTKFFNYKKLKFKNCIKPDFNEGAETKNNNFDFSCNSNNNTALVKSPSKQKSKQCRSIDSGIS